MARTRTGAPPGAHPQATDEDDDRAAYVAFVRWPSEAERRDELAERGVPRLLLVEPGAVPPDEWDDDEDWIRIPADPVDLHHRAEALRRFVVGEPTVVLDDDGLLRRGERWVALAPVEAALVETLLERWAELVRRPDLEAAAWPQGGVDGRALDRAVTRVRSKVAPLGLRISCVTACGYLLEAVDGGENPA